MRRAAVGLTLALMVMSPALAREVPMKLKRAHVELLSFPDLKGWARDDHAAAYGAFLKSCDAILNGTKAMRAARPMYGGLYKVCERAHALGPLKDGQARTFFETHFRPYRIAPPGETQGFFTGYYETEVEGSRVKTADFTFPFYKNPGASLASAYDRARIEDGALAGKGLEICWAKNPVDVFFAQIQGSTRVKLQDGSLLRLNYIAHNGMPYTPVGRYLIDKGYISKEEMSMDRIRQWMDANPEEAKRLRRTNRSYVFFQETDLGERTAIEGAQGVNLTPLRSLAVDKSIHVYGTPIWIDAELPLRTETPDTPLRKLMIAQDTGSAIVGPARADIFFGAGEELGHVAGRIKQHGQFVMLVPRTVMLTGEDSGAPEIPLPQPRPPEIRTRTAQADK
jgi:peptidoglycan lytic transglycosylase A